MNPDSQVSSLISGSILLAIEASRQQLKSWLRANLIGNHQLNLHIGGGGGGRVEGWGAQFQQSFWHITMYENMKLEVHMYAVTTYRFCCVCV